MGSAEDRRARRSCVCSRERRRAEWPLSSIASTGGSGSGWRDTNHPTMRGPRNIRAPPGRQDSRPGRPPLHRRRHPRPSPCSRYPQQARLPGLPSRPRPLRNAPGEPSPSSYARTRRGRFTEVNREVAERSRRPTSSKRRPISLARSWQDDRRDCRRMQRSSGPRLLDRPGDPTTRRHRWGGYRCSSR